MGFQVRVTIQTNLQNVFLHWHVRDTVVVLNEGNRPHLQCTGFNMFVPRDTLNGIQSVIEMCAQEAYHKRRQPSKEAARDRAETVFWAYVQPLANAGSFKYLVRILSTTDSNFPVAMANLRKARKKWVRIPQVMGW